jgi:5'-nucleotidase
VRRYQREVGPQVNRVIVTLADTIARTGVDSPLGNLLADAFRITAKAQVSFVNNGSIRITELPAGPVTWGTLYSLQPFENRIMRLTMTGAQIRGVVEQSVTGQTPGMHISGMTVRYNPAAPAGQRVQQIDIGGATLRDDAAYTVAVTDFLATGTGDGYRGFGSASRREDVGLTDLEALIRYLQALPQPVRRQLDRRYLAAQP